MINYEIRWPSRGQFIYNYNGWFFNVEITRWFSFSLFSIETWQLSEIFFFIIKHFCIFKIIEVDRINYPQLTPTHTHTHLHLHFIILLHLSCRKFPAHVKSSVTPVQILKSQKTNQFCLIALMLINCLNSSIFPRIPISYQYISLNSYTVSESRFSHLMLAFFFFKCILKLKVRYRKLKFKSMTWSIWVHHMKHGTLNKKIGVESDLIFLVHIGGSHLINEVMIQIGINPW